jgi:lambda repressor-like predicted transcriptional regulator
MDDHFPHLGTGREILLSLQRQQERRRELEHERQLAAIRTQSHALIWTGTADELTTTITKWFESGWIVAESLQDALQKASIHFLKPDRTPIIQPGSAKTAQHEPITTRTKQPSRREFVTLLLDAKGWSILEWALEAKVAPATANDYLDNKTKPYRSTRLKLAKALGLPVEQLPR